MPDTVALMRKRVLDMAVRGELVDQRPEEGTSEKLILSFKKENKLKEIDKDDIPYTIPKSWIWTDFEGIIKNIGTKNNQIKSKEIENTGAIPVVSQGKEYIDGFSNQVDKSIYPKKPVILFGDHTRNVKYIDFEFIIGADGTKVFESLLADPKYLFRWVQHASLLIENRGYSRHYSLLKKKPVPIPPLGEQERIVAKIEEIFSVIDQIGERKAEALTIINNIRQTALHDAIMGVLVEQNETDESASILYDKIQAEKEQLVKEKKIKKEKPLPDIDPDEVPFEIPDSWKWVRLGEVSTLLNGDRGKNYPGKRYWVDEGIPFINAGTLNSQYLSMDNMNFIPEERFELLSNGFVEKNDIIYCLRGSLGKVSINRDFDKGAIASSVVIIRSIGNINVEYLYYLFVSDYAKDLIQKVDSGTAQPNLSALNVSKYVIPLPPLSEQHCIVEKIDEIMAICDQMEAIFDGTSEANEALEIAE